MDELQKTDTNDKPEGRMARSILTVLALAVAGAALRAADGGWIAAPPPAAQSAPAW